MWFRRFTLPVALCLAVASAGGATPAEKPDPNSEAAARARLDQLRRELVQLGRAQRAGERTAEEQKARLMELNARQADLDRRMGANRDSLVKLLGALETYRRNPPPALLVTPRSAQDAVRAAILMREVLPELERRRRGYLAEADELNRIRRQAALASATLFSVESAEAERLARIDRLSQVRAGLETGLNPGQGAKAMIAQAAGAGAQSMGDLIARIDRPAARDPGASTAGRAITLDPPVEGRLVRRFGQIYAQAGADRRPSNGLAWRTAPGAVVLSPGEGEVDYAGPLKGQGLVLILRLSDNYRVVMTGLDQVSAASGARLTVGEPVGRMPGAGQPELYLELRRDAEPVDPRHWIHLAASARPG